MKTDQDALTVLYDYLNGSALTDALTGDLYRMVRPTGSLLEDAVINALPMSGEQFQRGTLNLNLYVPDVPVLIGDTEQAMPDTARLSELSALAAGLVRQVDYDECSFWVTNIATVQQPETGEHYANIRIDFQYFILESN